MTKLSTSTQESSQLEQQIANEGQALEVRANALVIDSDAQEGVAVNLLSLIAGNKKTLEDQRKFLVKPLNDHVKAINERFKQYSAPLDQADRTLRTKVLNWKKAKEAKRMKEEAKARELAEEEQAASAITGIKTIPLPPPTIPKAPRMTRAALGTASTKKAWTFKITDEKLIPREYLMVDTKKIAAVVKAGIRNIAGVEIYQEDQLAVRARTY